MLQSMTSSAPVMLGQSVRGEERDAVCDVVRPAGRLTVPTGSYTGCKFAQNATQTRARDSPGGRGIGGAEEMTNVGTLATLAEPPGGDQVGRKGRLPGKFAGTETGGANRLRLDR